MKVETNVQSAKIAKEIESLTRQLVLNYVNLNGGKDFLSEAVPDTHCSNFQRLEARLEVESRYSPQGTQSFCT